MRDHLVSQAKKIQKRNERRLARRKPVQDGPETIPDPPEPEVEGYIVEEENGD